MPASHKAFTVPSAHPFRMPWVPSPTRLGPSPSRIVREPGSVSGSMPRSSAPCSFAWRA